MAKMKIENAENLHLL